MIKLGLEQARLDKAYLRTGNVFVSVMLIPLLTWAVAMYEGGTGYTFSALKALHNGNSVYWIVTMLPLAGSLLAFWFFFSSEYEKQDLANELEKKNNSISKNAAFAQRIGEGDFKAMLDLENRNDDLGRSLLLMRENLLANKKKEEEQNWIAEGKDIIANVLRLHNSIDSLSTEVVEQLIKYIKATQGALYIYNEETLKLVNAATYAYNRKKYINQEFSIGEGLIGQCAYEKDIIYRTEIPDDYVTITSGILGDKKPGSLLIVPLITDEKLQGVIEFASLSDEISPLTITYLKELGEIIARTIFNLNINQKTEKLLLEAQQMTEELRENEEELRQSAEEMRATHEELEKSNDKLEMQIEEVGKVQKRLHSLLENASEVITIYDQNMKMIYESPSVLRILGYTPDEMMEGKDFDRLTPKGESDLKGMFEKLIKDPSEVLTIQYTYIRKDGKKIFIQTTGRNFLHDPAIKGIIMNSQDVTERIRAEKEERLKSKMQALSENSLDMIVRLGTTGKFFYANPVIERYTGLKPAEVNNRTINEVRLNDVLFNFFKESIKNIKSSPVKLNSELTLTTGEGERIMRIDAIPEFNENELETILFVGHDITEAKVIEQLIQDKNKKITESINYAERIQGAILPDTAFIRDFLPNSFIFYVPRDVVSGDFPWFFQKNENLYIAAVDCTGHGVPGALISFIGYFLLNNIVDHERELTAARICDELHAGVRHTLKQDRVDANARDGMDIAMVKIAMGKNRIEFAGAHRPLFMLRDGELHEFKGDRKAIGGIPHRNKPEKDFTNHKIDIEKGDKIFFFSDGLPDQIGGSEGKKFGPQRIRDIITGNPDFTMDEYNRLFTEDHLKWQGENKQIDDILVIGIEF
ncbi:MAG: PAS domain S-box protein [Bacteroidales bacterium]